MNSSPIRLVCFDLGGVLIRICRSWAEGCKAAGLEPRGECFASDPDMPRWNELGRLFGTGQIDGDTWSREISSLVSGIYSPQEIRAIHDAWLLGEYEGVGDIIRMLHDAGARTAALSNTNEAHWSRMHEFPAVMQLHHRIPSHELGLLKPDLEIYQEFQRRLNCSPSEILFFDDLQPNADAAKSLGWNSHVIDPMRSTASQIMEALRQWRVLASPLPQASTAPKLQAASRR